MNRHGDIRDQILTGIFTAFWLISRPFVWAYKGLKWLVVSTVKETGRTLSKVIGGIIAAGILGYIFHLLSIK